MSADREPTHVRLCDDDGMVSDQPVDRVPFPGDEGLTYRGLLNNLRAHTGLPPYEGEPFRCTGSAHLAGMLIWCTSPWHSGRISAGPGPTYPAMWG